MKLIALKDVCKINMGQSPNSSSYNDYGDGMPFFQGNADFGERYPITRVWCNTPTKIAQAEDILISVRAPIGALNYAKEECCIGRGLAAITPDRNKVSQDFIYWALKGKKAELNDKGNGSTFKAISRKILEETMIPDINFEQQHKCAENLEKIYGIIQNRRKELLALDDLIKARFVEMFGNGHDGFCNTKELGEFCKFQQGTQVPVEEQIEEQLEGYTRFLRIVDYTQVPQIPRYVSVKGRKIAEDSVVIVRYGATAGFVGHGYAGILANNLFEVVPDESILSKDFLYLALKYGTFEQEVHDKAFGAAMPALSFGMMNDIKVVTPNSTAQNGFADFVRQVDKSKVAVQKALDETQTLFDSLMQVYFG